jgi:hypothetical protein
MARKNQNIRRAANPSVATSILRERPAGWCKKINISNSPAVGVIDARGMSPETMALIEQTGDPAADMPRAP